MGVPSAHSNAGTCRMGRITLSDQRLVTNTHFTQGEFGEKLWRLVRLPQHKLWWVTDHIDGGFAVLGCYESFGSPETVRVCVESLCKKWVTGGVK